MEALTDELCRRFDGPEVMALVVMGSFARGDAGPFSDVDLVRFVREDGGAATQTVFLGDQLVVVSSVTPERIDQWFNEPQAAVEVVRGLQVARALLDRESFFANIQACARDFVWHAELQAKADIWASAELVGLIEEVHKGLNGLAAADRGRLLNARFGLSWLLSRVVAVQRGVLLRGDNGIYDDLIDALGADSTWICLRRVAWGIEDEVGMAPPLVEQVSAGLQLYVETARLLKAALQPEDAPKIHKTVARICTVLSLSCE